MKNILLDFLSRFDYNTKVIITNYTINQIIFDNTVGELFRFSTERLSNYSIDYATVKGNKLLICVVEAE